MEVVESTLVVPSEETPNRKIWLSNLDLPPILREYTPTIFVYRPHGDPNFFAVETLKASLSKALVKFYPLAGRLEFGHDGRIVINCTGEGALLTIVRTDLHVDDFDGFVPSQETRQMLVPAGSPQPSCIILRVQVTYFIGGEVALGIALHHTALDGHSALHFKNAWAGIAHGITDLLVPPSFDRTTLRSRSTPSIITIDHHHKQIDSPDSTTTPSSPPAAFHTAILYLSSDQINTLKNTNNYKSMSTFRAVMAHIWRCACVARSLSPEQDTRLYTWVNVRKRLNPPLPAGYFGNAVLPAEVVAKAGQIMSNSLEFGVDTIQSAVERLNDEYVRKLIDNFDVAPEELDENKWALQRTNVYVTSWLGMPFYEADFGWGKPELVVPAEMYCEGFGYIMDRPGSEGGGVSVLMSLEAENMEQFKRAFYQGLQA